MAKSCNSALPLSGAAASCATPPSLFVWLVFVGNVLTNMDVGGKITSSFEAKTLIHSGDTIGTPANADLMAFTVRTLGRTVKDPFVPTTGNMQIVAFLWKVFVTRTLTKREKRIGY